MKKYRERILFMMALAAIFIGCIIMTGCREEGWPPNYSAEQALFLDEPLDEFITEHTELYKIRKQFELLNRQLIEITEGCQDNDDQ